MESIPITPQAKSSGRKQPTFQLVVNDPYLWHRRKRPFVICIAIVQLFYPKSPKCLSNPQTENCINLGFTLCTLCIVYNMLSSHLSNPQTNIVFFNRHAPLAPCVPAWTKGPVWPAAQAREKLENPREHERILGTSFEKMLQHWLTCKHVVKKTIVEILMFKIQILNRHPRGQSQIPSKKRFFGHSFTTYSKLLMLLIGNPTHFSEMVDRNC